MKNTERAENINQRLMFQPYAAAEQRRTMRHQDYVPNKVQTAHHAAYGEHRRRGSHLARASSC